MSENIVEFMCESEDLEKACLVLSASKKRNFVAVQISPAVRVSIGEYLGLYRGEDAIGKVVAALTLLGADVVVDSAIAFDAVTLMRVNALKQAKDTGVGLPLFSSECAKWVEFAKAEYPDADKVDGEIYTFALRDNHGVKYGSYTYTKAEKTGYTYRRLIFENVSLTDVSEMKLLVFYIGQESKENPRHTLYVYRYDFAKNDYDYGTPPKQKPEFFAYNP